MAKTGFYLSDYNKVKIELSSFHYNATTPDFYDDISLFSDFFFFYFGFFSILLWTPIPTLDPLEQSRAHRGASVHQHCPHVLEICYCNMMHSK